MVATAFSLGKYLNDSYDLVLNVGIAGSFDQKIPLGSVVNITSDVLAELGAEDRENFLTINELGFGENTFNASFELTGPTKVKGITVNTVHGNAAHIKTIVERFKPQTESMEGAAVFYACEQQKIPCLQVRSISNYVIPRDKETWEIGLALKNLNHWLIDFIDSKSNEA